MLLNPKVRLAPPVALQIYRLLTGVLDGFCRMKCHDVCICPFCLQRYDHPGYEFFSRGVTFWFGKWGKHWLRPVDDPTNRAATIHVTIHDPGPDHQQEAWMPISADIVLYGPWYVRGSQGHVVNINLWEILALFMDNVAVNETDFQQLCYRKYFQHHWYYGDKEPRPQETETFGSLTIDMSDGFRGLVRTPNSRQEIVIH